MLPFSLQTPLQNHKVQNFADRSAKTLPAHRICSRFLSMSSSSALSESSPGIFTYSRKQKSLGLLCTNFVSLYDREGVHSIGLDDAAARLGVERRRIYDIVNVLESVGVLARKAMNQYTWKGFQAIPAALQELKEEGARENCCVFDGGNDNAKLSDDEEDDETLSIPSQGSQSENQITGPAAAKSCKPDKRREKSLALLTQNFVKLFVCSNVDVISLDEAAKLLLGDAQNLSLMRTKVRRLYDIANVLSSMNLIEKTHTPDSRKPVFRWLGFNAKAGSEPVNHSNPRESRKRMFGTDVTNISFERNKVDLFVDREMSMKKQNERESESYLQPDINNLKQETKQCLKGYEFGPFAPVSAPKVSASENKATKQVHDWNKLTATYRPQYQNQALRDLFSHYMEAWKSWYSEVPGKKHKQM